MIGRKVNVGIDYMRALPNSATGETERIFVSVLEGGTNNVAIALVANGLASVMKHRQDDQDRSLYYDDLIQVPCCPTLTLSLLDRPLRAKLVQICPAVCARCLLLHGHRLLEAHICTTGSVECCMPARAHHMVATAVRAGGGSGLP